MMSSLVTFSRRPGFHLSQLRLSTRNSHSRQFEALPILSRFSTNKRKAYHQHKFIEARASSSIAPSTPSFSIPRQTAPSRDRDHEHSHERDDNPNQAKHKHIENLISSLPLTRFLRGHKSGYTESNPYKVMHPSAQETHLVTTSLSHASRIPIDPIFFLKSPTSTELQEHEQQEQEQKQKPGRSQSQSQSQSQPQALQLQPSIIAMFYLATHLTGHAGFIHGGLLTTLFDDVFARLASEVFPSRVGMTGRLEVDFRAPAVPGRVVVFRAFVERGSGRKVWVRGECRCLSSFWEDDMRERPMPGHDGIGEEEREGVFVAEACGLFVEPRMAGEMVPLYPKASN